MISKIKLNPDIVGLPYGDRKKLLALTQGRKDLADLMSGNPDMALPPFIRERLKDKLDSGYAPYTNIYGLPELRERISHYLKTECDIEADPENELVITYGVQEALYIVMRTILQRGDEVLIPSPHYANYVLDTIACGGKPIFVSLDEKSGFLPDIKRLEKAITPKTRVLIFSNPSNPLGVVWPPQVIEKIARLARDHNLIVLVDEIYRELTYPDRPLSIGSLPGMKERTFTFNGFSKAYVMMGLRTGYVAGPAEAMFSIKQLHYVVALCPNYLGQHAALAAFDCPQEQLLPMYEEFRSKLDLLYRRVLEIPGVSCVKPQGPFYIFPNFKCLGLSSLDLALQLIEKAGVITMPGTEFGPEGEGYLRLTVCAGREQVEKGVERLVRFFRELV